jgi:hypothetical protein
MQGQSKDEFNFPLTSNADDGALKHIHNPLSVFHISFAFLNPLPHMFAIVQLGFFQSTAK